MNLAFLGTNKASEWFDRLAATLNLTDARYEAADRSYRSLSTWLERDGSLFTEIDFSVYSQGSFRLGTAIQPFNQDEDYDLDVVCEFPMSKRLFTQKQLHDMLGVELIAYAARYSMQEPTPWNMCWTLNYANDTKFHMDVLPCVPDGVRQRKLREEMNVSLDHVDKAVSITHKLHPNFPKISDEWPTSNPNGYASWFYERMKPVFDARRQAIMLVEDKANTADIPEFRVRTPLQLAIQVLKRHRDVCFSGGANTYRPTSIVITTLAAHAYQQETTVLEALLGVLRRMDQFIVRSGSAYMIVNPSDPRENFADAWNENKNKADAFLDWLETARSDFTQAATGTSLENFIELLAPRLGRELVESALVTTDATKAGLIGRARSALQKLLDAPHKKPLSWPLTQSGVVSIVSVKALRSGFRSIDISNNNNVERGASLTFEAKTNVSSPFDVYWQIVNTGDAAKAAGDLRGTFEHPRSEHGHLVRRENTKYPGTHSIECFIVKDGYCVARSGVFIVNIN